mgnify:CR=1 FL=1
MNIGILSLQGNYLEHYKKINELVNVISVKKESDLFQCDGLIIPGGESTVISKMLDYKDLRKSILESKNKIHIMGVCAGMIMLSKTNNYNNLKTLSIMDFKVKRNGWGRQVYSFNSDINLSFSNSIINATFIRAPKVTSCSNQVKCLATFNNEPILLTDGKHLACSFHPEYSQGTDVYNYFFELINKN